MHSINSFSYHLTERAKSHVGCSLSTGEKMGWHIPQAQIGLKHRKDWKMPTLPSLIKQVSFALLKLRGLQLCYDCCSIESGVTSNNDVCSTIRIQVGNLCLIQKMVFRVLSYVDVGMGSLRTSASISVNSV